jgi:hypothetical protein
MKKIQKKMLSFNCLNVRGYEGGQKKKRQRSAAQFSRQKTKVAEV